MIGTTGSARPPIVKVSATSPDPRSPCWTIRLGGSFVGLDVGVGRGVGRGVPVGLAVGPDVGFALGVGSALGLTSGLGDGRGLEETTVLGLGTPGEGVAGPTPVQAVTSVATTTNPRTVR
jgi:hypothetical protein